MRAEQSQRAFSKVFLSVPLEVRLERHQIPLQNQLPWRCFTMSRLPCPLQSFLTEHAVDPASIQTEISKTAADHKTTCCVTVVRLVSQWAVRDVRRPFPQVPQASHVLATLPETQVATRFEQIFHDAFMPTLAAHSL